MFAVRPQTMDSRGQMPVKGVRSVTGPNEEDLLEFDLIPATELSAMRSLSARESGRKSVPLVDLAATAARKQISQDLVLELAGKTGPIFGGNRCESLREWGQAVQLALPGVRLQQFINGDLSVGALGDLGVGHSSLVNKDLGISFDIYTLSREVSGDYARLFDHLPILIRTPRDERIDYTFARLVDTPDSDSSSKFLELLVCSMPSEMTEADYAILSHAVFYDDEELYALVSIQLSFSSSSDTVYGFAADAELDSSEQSLSVESRDAMASMVQGLIAAHISSARVDLFAAGQETGYLSFDSHLAWMWYDFAQSLNVAKIGYCRDCGRAFSLVGHRGIARSYCSEACKTSGKNKRMKQARDRAREMFFEGCSVEEIAASLFFDDPAGYGRVKQYLSSSVELRKRIAREIQEAGQIQTPLIQRCIKEGLEMKTLISTGVHRELKRSARKMRGN